MAEITVNISEAKKAWTYLVKPHDEPGPICRLEATANRLNNPYAETKIGIVNEFEIFKIGNQWYGPIQVIQPSEQDFEAQKKIDEVNKLKQDSKAAIQKALELGLTQEEISLIIKSNVFFV